MFHFRVLQPPSSVCSGVHLRLGGLPHIRACVCNLLCRACHMRPGHCVSLHQWIPGRELPCLAVSTHLELRDGGHVCGLFVSEIRNCGEKYRPTVAVLVCCALFVCMCYWKLILIFLKAISLMHTWGETLFITKYWVTVDTIVSLRHRYSSGYETAQEYKA